MMNRLARNLMKDGTLDRNLRLENLRQMPRDSLALPILVGSQDKLLALRKLSLELRDDRLFASDENVKGTKIVGNVDAKTCPGLMLVLGGDAFSGAGKFADVADAGVDAVAGIGKEFLDSGCLGGGFDYDEGEGRLGGGGGGGRGGGGVGGTEGGCKIAMGANINEKGRLRRKKGRG